MSATVPLCAVRTVLVSGVCVVSTWSHIAFHCIASLVALAAAFLPRDATHSAVLL